jgi:hypothetical protein
MMLCTLTCTKVLGVEHFITFLQITKFALNFHTSSDASVDFLFIKRESCHEGIESIQQSIIRKNFQRSITSLQFIIVILLVLFFIC